MRTGTRGDRIQVAHPPNVYQDTAELLAELGLDALPDGPVRDGERAEVPRPATRTEAKRRAE